MYKIRIPINTPFGKAYGMLPMFKNRITTNTPFGKANGMCKLILFIIKSCKTTNDQKSADGFPKYKCCFA